MGHLLVALLLVLQGRATWYGPGFHGGIARDGSVFDQNRLTCAVDDSQWERLRGQWLLVCQQGIPDCVHVRVTDTGWLARYGVAIDLSRAAFGRIALWEQGVVDVDVWMEQEQPF